MQKCMKCMGEIGQEAFCPHCGNEIGRDTAFNGQLPEGTILERHYIVGRVIGRDALGITYIAWDAEQEERVAIREWFPEEFCRRHTNLKDVEFLAEQSLASDLQKQFLEFEQEQSKLRNSEMLVKILAVFRENGTVYCTEEYLEGQTIRQLLRRENPMRQDESRGLFDKMLQTADKMHLQGIVHGNLTPDNIVIRKDGRLVFLNRRWFSEETNRVSNALFTNNYAAPEICTGMEKESQSLDTYSIYAVYYRILTGVEPVSSREQMKGKRLPSPSELGIFINPEEEKEIMKKLSIETGRFRKPGKKRAGIAAVSIGIIAAGVAAAWLLLPQIQKMIRDTKRQSEIISENMTDGETTDNTDLKADDEVRKREGTETAGQAEKGNTSEKEAKKALNSELSNMAEQAGGRWRIYVCDSDDDKIIDDTKIRLSEEVRTKEDGSEATGYEMQEGNAIKYLFFGERGYQNIIQNSDYADSLTNADVEKIVKNRDDDEYNKDLILFGSPNQTPEDNLTNYAKGAGIQDIEWNENGFRVSAREGADLLQRIYDEENAEGNDAEQDSNYYSKFKSWINQYNEKNPKGCVLSEGKIADVDKSQFLEFYSEGQETLEYFACVQLRGEPECQGFKVGIMAEDLESEKEEDLEQMVGAIYDYYEKKYK